MMTELNKVLCDYCKKEVENYYTLLYYSDGRTYRHICFDCEQKLVDTSVWLKKNGYEQKFWINGYKKKKAVKE